MSSEPAAPRPKGGILDANILIRAVLGRRVLSLLGTYADWVSFLTPELAFADVRAHLPDILTRKGLPPEAITQLVEQKS